MTLELQARQKSDLWDMACIFVKLNIGTYTDNWWLITWFRYNAVQYVAVQLTEPPQKLLMLDLRSFSGGGCDIVDSIFSHKGGR